MVTTMTTMMMMIKITHFSSSYSIGTATLVGYGLLNYR